MTSSIDIRLRDTFLAESVDFVNQAEELLLELEPTRFALVDDIYRNIHNLKGASGAMGLERLVGYIHVYENLLTDIKTGLVPVTEDSCHLLLKGLDFIRKAVESLSIEIFSESYDAEAASNWFGDQAAELRGSSIESAVVVEQKSVTEGLQLFGDDPATVATAPEPDESAITRAGPSSQQENWFRISMSKVDALMRLSSEQQIIHDMIRTSANSSSVDIKKLCGQIEQMNTICQNLQDVVVSLRMVPIGNIFHKLKRIVRDTARECEKEINFLTSGETLELDKKIVDSLIDPLTHIVRNAIDHGVESADQRQASGKPAQGSLKLDAHITGSRFTIVIEDDGGGIDAQRVLAKAKANGVVDAEAKLDPSQSLQLIFENGLSTKETASSISGRGVGLDVVRDSVKRLRGQIEVNSELGQGTQFKIELPLNYGLIDGFIVNTIENRYVVSVDEVREVVDARAIERVLVSGQGSSFSYIKLRKKRVKCFSLSGMLTGFEDELAASGMGENSLIVLQSNRQECIGIFVADIERQMRATTRALPGSLRERIGHVGLTVLGDGKPAAILSLNLLVDHYLENYREAA